MLYVVASVAAILVFAGGYATATAVTVHGARPAPPEVRTGQDTWFIVDDEECPGVFRHLQRGIWRHESGQVLELYVPQP